MHQKNNDRIYANLPKRVLITRFSALGDVAMTIPVVYSVCMAHPDTQFLMLTQKVASTMFLNMPDNLQVKGVKIADYRSLTAIRRLWKEVKKEFNPDAFVDLHSVLRTWQLRFWAWLDRVPSQGIDKGRANKRALTRRNDKHLLPQISTRARYREVFQRFGFDSKYRFLSLFEGKSAEVEAFNVIYDAPKGDEKWIAIAPFAKHQGKIYPLDKMEKVVETLAARKNFRIFLFGNETEKDTLQKWAEGKDNVINVAKQRYGFNRELALLSHCDAMLSMDSANMHLASLVNLTAVTVWGATHPYCGFLGWKQKEENVVQLNLTCRPCSVFGDKPCHSGDYFCLTGIRPEMIVTAVDNALANHTKPTNEEEY